MTWTDFATITVLLAFMFAATRVLLKEKAIGNENTLRFAGLTITAMIVIIIALVPARTEHVTSGLTGLAGTLLGYVIRDIGKGSTQKENKDQSKTGS